MKTTLTEVEKRLVQKYWSQKKEASAKGYRIDNSSLYAGSPMYYYCRYCGIHTETLPETHRHAPKTVCDVCAALQRAALQPPPALEEVLK